MPRTPVTARPAAPRPCLLAGCDTAARPPAETAAASPEKVLYEDGHIRLVEVTNRPGDNLLSAVPYPSVVFSDTVSPRTSENPAATEAATSSDAVKPKDGRRFPACFTQNHQSARTVTVLDDFPQHYYRIDYKRVDGTNYAANWQAWYADVFGPPAKVVADLGETLAKGPPLSSEWPYDAGYSTTASAPANHTVRYADNHIEMVEVAIRQGETENMHGHPYPSVYADDGGFAPAGAVYKNVTLGPDVGPPWGTMSGPVVGPKWPVCFSAVPEPPQQVSMIDGPPQHFYRVHFKRVDNEAIVTDWKTLYPTG